MNNQLECEVCLEQFDEKEHIPRSLTCGHTLCTACISSTLTSNKGNLLCPFCRISSTSSLTKKVAKDFPVNYTLLKLLQPAPEEPPCNTQEGSTIKEDEEAIRKINQVELDSAAAQLLMCEDHLNQLQQQKSLLNNNQKLLETHKIKFEEAFSNHQKLLVLTTNQFIGKVKSVEDLLAKGCLIQSDIKENVNKLEELFKSGDDCSVITNLQNHNDTLFEWTKQTIPHQDSESLISTAELITSATSKAVHSLNGIAASVISRKVDSSISEVESNPSTSQGIDNYNIANNSVRNIEPSTKSRKVNVSTKGDQINEIVKFLQSSTHPACNKKNAITIPLGATNLSIPTKTTAQELLTILEDAEIRGQMVYAITDIKQTGAPQPDIKQAGAPQRVAQIKMVDGLTMLYCLQENVNLGNSQKIPYSTIQHLIPRSGARTFIEISWTSKLRGRVITKMYGETNRGKQFKLMCSGELGPSYVDTKLDQVRAVFGSYIQGGNYDGKDGKALISGLENGGNCSHGLKDGMIVGSNKSTLFTIYHKSATFQHTMAFGEVESGLETVRFIPKMSDARISNCGLILETQIFV